MRGGCNWFNIPFFAASAKIMRSRWYLALVCLFGCVPAAAAITCDQLGNLALATEQYRNQGESLSVLLAEAEKLEVTNKLTKEDMVRVKQTVQRTFDRSMTPYDVRKDCKDAPAK
jgi:hypothetical protein